MPRILVLTRYERLGASSRVRFLQFLPALARRGFSFTVQPFLDNDYIVALYKSERIKLPTIARAYRDRLAALLRARNYDLIWMEKEALPWLPAALERALIAGMPYVVDLDDAWFHRYDQNPSPIVRGLMAKKIDAVMGRAAIVVAGNDYLAERARSAGAERTEILPSVIDLDRYQQENAVNAQPAARQTPIVIGWIGIPINAPYLAAIEPALRAIAASRSVELHIVGGAAPAAFAGLPVKVFDWSESTEIDAIGAFDIGIMPLTDTPWERGKCAYKLVQVMAAGRPVVASPVGANRIVVENGVNGFLADTPEMWLKSLTALIDDPSLRATMGQKARQSVEHRYTIERVLPELESILLAAARRDR